MKQYLLSAWNIIDPIYYQFTRLKYIRDHNQQKTLFRVRLTRYRGSRLVLSDQTVINKNDLLVKIHLHNVRVLTEMAQIKSEIKRAVYIYHMIKRALPQLAQYIQTHKKAHQIKGIIGITSLYRGAERLGFDVRLINNPFYRRLKTATCAFINILSNNKFRHNPAYLLMSKQKMNSTYAPSTPNN